MHSMCPNARKQDLHTIAICSPLHLAAEKLAGDLLGSVDSLDVFIWYLWKQGNHCQPSDVSDYTNCYHGVRYLLLAILVLNFYHGGHYME